MPSLILPFPIGAVNVSLLLANRNPFPAMPPVLFAEAFSNGQIIALVAIVCGISLTGVIIVAGLRFVQRRHELWHETARIALEKGQPMPENPDEPGQRDPLESERNDIRSGLILVGVAAGLWIFFSTLDAPQVRYVGAIPGFIGIALLAYGLISAQIKRSSNASGEKPRD